MQMARRSGRRSPTTYDITEGQLHSSKCERQILLCRGVREIHRDRGVGIPSNLEQPLSLLLLDGVEKTLRMVRRRRQIEDSHVFRRPWSDAERKRQPDRRESIASGAQ